MHFCFRRGRGVSGRTCDLVLQATGGEIAEFDYSLGGGSRPRGTNDPSSRAGFVGPLLILLKTSLLLLVAGFLAAACGFGGGWDLTLGYLGWDENVANSYLTKVLLEEDLGYEKVELKLAKDDPAAFALIKAMRLDEEQVGSLELATNKTEDPEVGVRRWLEEKEKRELVRPWVEAAKDAQEA